VQVAYRIEFSQVKHFTALLASTAKGRFRCQLLGNNRSMENLQNLFQPGAVLLSRILLVTFFACAKKVTKKAQPISMRNISSVENFLGRNRRLETVNGGTALGRTRGKAK